MKKNFILKVKKPHKVFAVGDLLVGQLWDGCAERMICYGWSSKLNRMIGNPHPIFSFENEKTCILEGGYSVRYASWNKKGQTKNGHADIIHTFGPLGPDQGRKMFFSDSKEEYIRALNEYVLAETGSARKEG